MKEKTKRAKSKETKSKETKSKGKKIRKEKVLEDFRKIAYNYDASPFSGNSVCVYCPENEEDIIKFVKSAIKYKIDIVPRGGGTSVVGGAVPNNSVVLDLSKLNKITIDERKKIAIAEAGATIAELNREASKFGLILPVIPSSHEVATIGGAIATNASGLRAIKYGKMKDWVRSIKAVDGNGKIINGNI